MNEGPSPSLVARIRDVILATFDVSAKEAQEQACGLAVLAEGWGNQSVKQLDWAYTVRKRLGETFKWRSDAERQKFESERKLISNSYERYIQQNKKHA